METDLVSFVIAGVRHHVPERAVAMMRALPTGTVLELVREPGNAADSNAVAVHYRGRRLGYVPATTARTVARVMDWGTELHAVVDNVMLDGSVKPYPDVFCTAHRVVASKAG